MSRKRFTNRFLHYKLIIRPHKINVVLLETQPYPIRVGKSEIGFISTVNLFLGQNTYNLKLPVLIGNMHQTANLAGKPSDN